MAYRKLYYLVNPPLYKKTGYKPDMIYLTDKNRDLVWHGKPSQLPSRYLNLPAKVLIRSGGTYGNDHFQLMTYTRVGNEAEISYI